MAAPPLALPADQLATSRQVAAREYLTILEREYLNCVLRLRIYLYEKDQEFYAKMVARKKEHIERVATRERLPSILTDATRRAEAEARLYGTGGLPKFYYKDYSDEQRFALNDRRHYFQAGKHVRLADGRLCVSAGLTPDGELRVRPAGQRRARTTRHALDQATRTFQEEASTQPLCPPTTTSALPAAA